ncbi:MAG: GTPase HflX [Ruminococcaceae bacterium]|nr:GTPase HflX [Oscillospiraceae bacterium]
MENNFERAVLVAVDTDKMKDGECEVSLAELERLLDTAGGSVFAKMTQKMDSPSSRTCIGSGKLMELSELCKANDIKLVIFDMELTPMQIRNIEDGIDVKDIRVLDRSMLILDIFALHATSREGKLQVELAQLKYTAPRLTGKGTELSRLGGGIGTRGPGESKLETDRRHLKRRAELLEAELEVLDRNRLTQRKARERSGITKVAIVGYTNAGKSTLLNRLTDAGILAEDKLFATLDPTTRKFALPCGVEILLTDTVGFIRNLPHHLIKAFKSTLDEAVYADIILIIVDASDPEAMAQLEVTEKLLSELGASGKQTLYVYNKCDAAEGFDHITYSERDSVAVSALTGEGIDALVEKLEIMVQNGKSEETFVIPNSDAGVVNRLYASAEVIDVDYGADGITVRATVDAKTRGQYDKYRVKKEGESDGEEDEEY